MDLRIKYDTKTTDEYTDEGHVMLQKAAEKIQ